MAACLITHDDQRPSSGASRRTIPIATMCSPPYPLFSSGHCVCCQYWVHPTSDMRPRPPSTVIASQIKKQTLSQEKHSSTSPFYHGHQPPATLCRVATCDSATPCCPEPGLRSHSWCVELGFRNNQAWLFASVLSQTHSLFSLGRRRSRPPSPSTNSASEGCHGVGFHAQQ